MLDTGKTVMDIPDEEVDEEEDGEDNADEDMEEDEKEDDEAMDTADELLKNDDEASGSEEAEGIIGGDGDRIATPASLFPAGFGERKILSPKRQLEIMATQSYMDDIKRVFSPSESKIQMFMTPEKIISYGIYDYEDIKMGIIRLDSFMPASDPSGTKSIEIVRGLLVNQLKNTDCLVFDVRRKRIKERMVLMVIYHRLPYSLPTTHHPF